MKLGNFEPETLRTTFQCLNRLATLPSSKEIHREQRQQLVSTVIIILKVVTELKISRCTVD